MQHQERKSMVSQTTSIAKSHIQIEKQTSFALIADSKSDIEFIIAFAHGDLRDPVNFSKTRKWTITIVASFFTFLASMSAVSFSSGQLSMIQDLDCTKFQATLGLSLYCLGFGVLPLVSSSFGEEFGRKPLYYISMTGFLLMHIMVALAQNIQTVLIARFLQGAFGSTGVTVVAGTVADIWAPHERGLPMSFYAFIAFAGNGVAGLFGGWTEMNPALQWRWIQWISLMIGGAYMLILIAVIHETRSTVILRKMAHNIRNVTGDQRYRPYVPKGQDMSLRMMIYISCTRPIYMVIWEPIVLAVSVWIGFAWGVYYCMIESIPGVLRDLHDFNQGEIGTVYMTITVGSLLGFFTNMYQETLYQRNVAQRGTQARLYSACIAGFLFPASMFMFAWSSFSYVPWEVLIIALIVYTWAVFTIYLAVFTYLADCYGIYASSALAGQSLFRNIMATIFPLFADRMFLALGYRWSNSLFAFAALAMSPIPIILFLYGRRIIARSRLVNVVDSENEHKKNTG